MDRVKKLIEQKLVESGTPEDKLLRKSSLHHEELVHLVTKIVANEMYCDELEALATALLGRVIKYQNTLGNYQDVFYSVGDELPENVKLPIGKPFRSRQ